MRGILGSSPSLATEVTICLERIASSDCRETLSSSAGVLSADQPIATGSRGLHVAFDGALYNTEQLLRDHRLDVSSFDGAEVVLALFQLLGPSFTDHLEGAYAFIIIDDTEGTLFFGVDEMGIKPLYLSRYADGVLLCSTLAALPLDRISDVERVPCGTVWDLDGLRHTTGRVTSDTEWTTALRKALQAQIPQDIRWCSLLSGGVDSSVLCSLAAQQGPLMTLTCGMDGSEDLEQGRRVAELLDSEHHEHRIDPDQLKSMIHEVVIATASFEPWLVLGGIGTLAAARAGAALGVKAMISGEGADELFAGYRDFDHTPAETLEATLRDQQNQLGATECLRLDRCSRAAGVEVRVPFLAREVVAAVRALPVGAKRNRPGSPDSITKVALREYASQLGLPEWVAYRAKVGFSKGIGITPTLTDFAHDERSRWASPADRERYAAPGIDMDAPVAAWLLGLWLSHYGDALGSDWTSLEERGLVRATAQSLMERSG
ncbi:MAG: asparagine synthase-related protein [Propionibacteriaceae bacterium]|nr:asparagine synthase-related protein [Propionibacteriaceae bacterium]